MMVRTLIAAIVFATFGLGATDADAGKRLGSSSRSSNKPPASSPKKAMVDGEHAAAKKARQDDDSGPTIRVSAPRSSSSSTPSSPQQLAGRSGSSVPVGTADTQEDEAARMAIEKAKRKRAEELAAIQAKIDAQIMGRKLEEDLKRAEAAAAAQQQRERQEAARVAQEQREREARRAKLVSAPPTCIIKPVMSDADRAKCR